MYIKTRLYKKEQSMVGFLLQLPIPISAYTVGCIMHFFFVPLAVIWALLMGFHKDDPNIVANAANVASQLVDNAEAMLGLTDTAGADNLNKIGDNNGEMLGATLAVGTAVRFYAMPMVKVLTMNLTKVKVMLILSKVILLLPIKNE